MSELTDEIGRLADPLAEPADRVALREAMRKMIAEISPTERTLELDSQSRFDDELYAGLAGLGALSTGAGKHNGGAGDVRDQMAVVEELAAGPTSMAVAMIVHFLVIDLITTRASIGQQERWLAPLLSGEAKASFALTEPAAGTDIANGMQTTGKKVGDEWVLNGRKTWISGAARADVFVILARTAPPQNSTVDGITMFLVPAGSPGISVSNFGGVGLRAADPCDVILDNVSVPDSAVMGEEHRGFRLLMGSLNRERLNAAAGAIGAARGALTYTIDYARDRTAFDRQLGSFQAVQHRLVDGAIALESARGLLRRAGDIAAGGGRADLISSMAKVACSEAAVKITQDGLETLGAAGLNNHGPLQRWFRDVRLWVVAPLANDMVRNYLGERLLDLPRSF